MLVVMWGCDAVSEDMALMVKQAVVAIIPDGGGGGSGTSCDAGTGDVSGGGGCYVFWRDAC